MGTLLLLSACGDDRPACALAWSTGAADPSVAVSVEISRFAGLSGTSRLLGTRPVTLEAPAGAAKGTRVTIAGTSDIAVLDKDGAPLDLPFETDALPVTLHVEGSTVGEATLTASVTGCEPEPLVVRVVPVTPLAGRTREEAPGFGFDDVYALGEPLEVAFDMRAQPDGIGAAQAWVVAHRSVEAWGEDRALVDVTGEVEGLSLDDADLATAGRTVWAAVAPDAGVVGSAYDVVLDLDGDATFSPGDRLDQGADGAGLRVAGDLAEAGPHAVSQADVSGGDWLGQRVYWPDDLAALGPRPLIVISHGNGHQHTWYDYLGEHLASWGYVVMAHENETMPGIEAASTTTLTNTDWFLTHLDQVGGGALVDLVDAHAIAWIGHSRGGEGIVRAHTRLLAGGGGTGDVPEGFTADDVRVLVSIAPTVFNSVTMSDPGDVRYHLLAGSSDGDVTGGTQFSEAQSFRLYQAAQGTRSSTYVYGASHEDFDCCGYDDGQGPDQIEREDAQRIAKAYLLAAVAEGLEDDPTARALLQRDPMGVPATGFTKGLTTTVLSTWRPAEGMVIDDYQLFGDLGSASSNAAVIFDVTNAHEGLQDDADTQLTWTGSDPMNGMTQAGEAADDAQGIVFEWDAPAYYRYELPTLLRDWREGRFLTLAACQETRNPLTIELDGPLDFSVTLTDGAGVSVTRSIRPYATIAPPYNRRGDGEGRGWANAFTTVRLPLVDFTAGATALDLSDVRSVQLDFGQDGDSPFGRIGLDDVEVVR
jgi:hypothetical protein